MKKSIISAGIVVLILSMLFCPATTVFAFNADNPENAGRYYAFNQFYVDHFTGCANGDVDYLSHYNDITIALASGSAIDRMKYIADNEWIPIAGYSPKTNVMNMYFCGEQNLDYTGQAIQIDPIYANASLADAITGLSDSDIESLSDMTKAAVSFEFNLDFLPEKASNQNFAVSNVYVDFCDFIRLFESEKINVTVGANAILKPRAPMKINTLALKSGSTLDLSLLSTSSLSSFSGLKKITSDGVIVFPAEATAEQKNDFLKNVEGAYTAVVETTSIKIVAPAMMTVSRNSKLKIPVVLNLGAYEEGIVWSVSNNDYAIVDSNGVVTTLNKMGMLVLTAKDPIGGLSHSIVLRIT
jgi:hypothetical protein